jgi:hypothetical protein
MGEWSSHVNVTSNLTALEDVLETLPAEGAAVEKIASDKRVRALMSLEKPMLKIMIVVNESSK